MADEDLSVLIDVEALARLLATPTYDLDACRAYLAAYIRQGDGDAGRGIGKLAEAFKLHVGARLPEHKPTLIAWLVASKHGVYSPEVAHRAYASLGHPIWHHYASTHLLDASPFAIAELMEGLHVQTGDVDALVRDLVAWIELADPEARARIEPIARRSGSLELGAVGYTPAVGARMLEVLAMPAASLEDKLERVYANLAAQISQAGLLTSFAILLDSLDGRCEAPAFQGTSTADFDRSYERASFEVAWRLSRRYRAIFDRYPQVLAANLRSDEALGLLGIVDEATELPAVGARGERWRVMRAGRLVMTTGGAELTYLPRFTVSAAASEAAARRSYTKKLEAKQATARKR